MLRRGDACNVLILCNNHLYKSFHHHHVPEGLGVFPVP